MCLTGSRGELAEVLAADVYPTLHRGGGADQEQRVRLHKADGVAAGLTRLVTTAPDDQLSDSVLALAALVAAGRSVALAGHLRIGVRGEEWAWVTQPDREDHRRLTAATHQLILAAGPFTPIAVDVGIRFAESAGDELAATLPLPRGLTGSPDEPAAWSWAERVRLRRETGGARLTILLEPPERRGPWLATLALVEGGTGEVHRLRDRFQTPRLNDVDVETVRDLVRVERDAAREVSRAPGLFTQYYARLKDKDLLRFLDTVDDLAAAGIEVRAPKGLLAAAGRLRTAVSVSGAPAGMTTANLRLTAVADLDGRPLDAAEVTALADAQSPFVLLGSDWVRVPSGARAAARLLERAERDPIAPVDLLEDEFQGFDIDAVDVSGWVGATLRSEAPLKTIDPVGPPPGLQATLRPYQRVGLTWLTWCEENGLGGILADDMGLGKTVQLLSRILADHPAPTLVVCPTTLLENWRREAARFAPELKVAIHHGKARELTDSLDADVVLTTYALLVRDPELREIEWHRVILDEAQAIKNPSAKSAQAARALKAPHRFAVTGTPVENHLGDLWSLMAFAQPGLLGSFAGFRRRYLSAEGRADDRRVERLRMVVSPFLLRRSKRDRTVVPDLPDKIEVRRDCALSREQVGVYEAVVRRLEEEAKTADGTKRRGVILAGLTRLKQACVHPQLALGMHQEGLDQSSGKVEELLAIIEEAVDEGDALLVFSQYATFLRPLADLLTQRGAPQPLRLDGSMSRDRRSQVVDQFSAADGPPVLLASLKAGGTGLNLVRANHVVHLDRWWNPAIEDQGSDRAWRIGQAKNVIVHNLVCPGTVEERIARVLDSKRATAGQIVGDEATPAVTEMSDADLHDLITLVRDEQILLRKV